MGADDEAMKLRLEMVREARILFGADRAALLWVELGLPAATPVPASRRRPPIKVGQPKECLAWLLAQPLAGSTVRALLLAALDGEMAPAKALARSGLRVETGERRGFLIASAKPQADALFAASRWHSKRWIELLRRLDGAEPVGALRFDRWTSRSTFIPCEYLSGDG